MYYVLKNRFFKDVFGQALTDCGSNFGNKFRVESDGNLNKDV